MNSAAIIAACAVTARKRNENALYKRYFDKDLEFYYRVFFRKYLHFNSIKVVIPNNEPLINSEGIIAQSMTALKTIEVEPKSIAKQYTFTVRASKCPNGIDDYIEDHIKEFEDSGVWGSAEDEIINKYLEEFENKYGYILDKSYLDYNVQYCWEVESEMIDVE